jgi:metalloprotease
VKSALQKDAALSLVSDASSGVRKLANSQLGKLIMNVINAQYSQASDIEADDYALTFMAAKKYPHAACPAAMDKLAALGGGGIGRDKNAPRSGSARQTDAREDPATTCR